MVGGAGGRGRPPDQSAFGPPPAFTPAPLPRPLSSFVGRRPDLDELERTIPQRRLVTLVAVGGGGKTRLAVEVAQRLAPSFADGVAFADLSSVVVSASVPETVAAALGLSRGASGDLPGALGNARLLLVIDNAEHLVDAVAGLVGDLLARCRNLRVLVTSREALDIGAETLWRLPNLRLPPDGLLDPDALRTFDGVDLFLVRAAEAGSRFELTAGNAARVVAICRRLDGIPLALELAAARVASLGLDEIEGQLREGMRLLSWNRRDAPARHATIHAAIEWSCRSLEPLERLLFERLSVFVGTFDLAAARAVCADDDRETAIADALRGLIQKSLLVPHPQADGGMRYRMLAVVRSCAAEALAPGDERALAARHAAHYCRVVAAVDSRTGSDSRTYLRRVEAEYGNVRRAVDWAARESVEMDVEFAVRLMRYWALAGRVHEGRERIRSTLAGSPLSAEQEAVLSTEACRLALIAGDLDDAAARVERAMVLLERVRDPRMTALALHHRAGVRMSRGDLTGAEEDLRRSLAQMEGMPPTSLAGWVMNSLACLQLERGQDRDALDTARRAQDVITEAGDHPIVLAQLQNTLGRIHLAMHRPEDARRALTDALRCAIEHGLHHTATEYLRGLAVAAADQGDAEQCLELLGAAWRCSRVAGSTGVTRLRAFVLSTDAAEKRSRLRLGPRRAEMAWSRGTVMELGDAMRRVSPDGDRAAPPLPLRHARDAGAGADPAKPNERLRRARHRQDWTQEDVARRLGTTKLTVSRWERGIQTPSLYFRGRLCGLFGSSADDLGLTVDADLEPADQARGPERHAR